MWHSIYVWSISMARPVDYLPPVDRPLCIVHVCAKCANSYKDHTLMARAKHVIHESYIRPTTSQTLIGREPGTKSQPNSHTARPPHSLAQKKVQSHKSKAGRLQSPVRHSSSLLEVFRSGRRRHDPIHAPEAREISKQTCHVESARISDARKQPAVVVGQL